MSRQRIHCMRMIVLTKRSHEWNKMRYRSILNEWKCLNLRSSIEMQRWLQASISFFTHFLVGTHARFASLLPTGPQLQVECLAPPPGFHI